MTSGRWGLGYANLGALTECPWRCHTTRMRDATWRRAVTALMCGEAYAQSARVAERMGAVSRLRGEPGPIAGSDRMHREAMRGIKPDHVQAELYMGAQDAWDAALELGEKAWLQELAGDGAGADGHDRFHDGLRHDRIERTWRW